MKKSLFLPTVFVLGLTACASDTATRQMAVAPDPMNPQVFIVGGKHIVVDQEPIIFREKNVPIIWHLRVHPSSPYRFPSSGIDIKDPGSEFTGCQSQGLTFVCFAVNSKPGRYKYTINVLDGNKSLTPLDPWIVNE